MYLTKEEASQANDEELKKLKDVNGSDLVGYDFVFIGSPLHSANLAAPVKEFLGSIQPGSGQKMAGFILNLPFWIQRTCGSIWCYLTQNVELETW